MPSQEFTAITTQAQQIFSHPTWDIILLFALLAAGFFYGISAGKRRIAATILYTYVALAVSSALPLEKWISTAGDMERFYIRAGAFLGIFIILILTLGSRRTRSFAPASAWWQIFLLSFLQVGLLIHTTLGFLPADKIKLLAPLTKNVFANANFHIWWLAIPLLVLIILKRMESRDD